MTERTTPITVHLTDDQIAYPRKYDLNLFDVLCKAILAQRPRPIAVGDRVRYAGADPSYLFDVQGVYGGFAWLWLDNDCWGGARLADLTRVDDEAQP